MPPTPPDPPAQSEEPPADGGKGGCGLSAIKSANVVRRALKERWPIPPETREKLPAVLTAIMADDEADARARVAAARALLEADKVNLEQEKRDAGDVQRIDVTTGGKPLESSLLTPADIALARAILAGAGGDVRPDG